MNWFNIISTVVATLPNLSTLVTDLTKALQVQTTPVPSTATLALAGQGKPSDTVKTIQRLLNQFVKPNPPLKEDGWLGPKTEAAIQQALQMATPYLTMFGIRI